MVDAMSSHDLLSFIDMFSSYNQIRMSLENEEKNMFIIDQGLFLLLDHTIWSKKYKINLSVSCK